MNRKNDLTGLTVGHLVVLKPKRKNRKFGWLCLCECGNKILVTSNKLSSGMAKSCGCVARKNHIARITKHGRAVRGEKDLTYSSWRKMRDRCNAGPDSEYFPRYAGRGIKLCSRWNDFNNFIKDMGERPSQRHSIGRLDNDGGYEPDNCRWETMREQTRNTNRVVKLTFKGKTQCLRDWSKETGMNYYVLRRRAASGWSASECLTKPYRFRKRIPAHRRETAKAWLKANGFSE